MMRTILAAVALATALHAAAASAQESLQQTEDRERRFRELEGFRRGSTSSPKMSSSSSVHGYQGMYFRPDVGVGYMSVSVGDASFTGPAGFFGLHVGGAVSPKVLIGLHLYESFLPNPSAGGVAAGASASGITITGVGLGPELMVCLPADFYIATTVALTRMTVSTDAGSGSTDAGFGQKVALGFDRWAASGKWSLGAAIQASYSFNQDSGADPVMVGSWTVGGALSMSFD